MSETPTPVELGTLHGTVSFTRKISDGNYGVAEAFMSVQFDILPDDGGEQIIANARHAFLQAKAVVFEQLGVEHTLDESGVVVEVVKRAFPGTVEAADAPKAAAGGGGGAEPPYSADTKDPDERKANREWAEARLESHPNEFWDNRQDKRNPKAPDFKHKSSGIGVWQS